MSRLNRGEDVNGRPIDAPTSFFPGVAVNPTPDDLALEVRRFEEKVEAGARYAITQIVFDLEPLDHFAKHLGGEWPIPILVEIFPLTSHRLALRLHNEVPGISVPESLQNALQDAGANAAELGFAHARRLVEEARRFSGVCLVAPFRRPLRVLELLAD
jgi:homocysteine S-methyltransferase